MHLVEVIIKLSGLRFIELPFLSYEVIVLVGYAAAYFKNQSAFSTRIVTFIEA